jgi:hypothetical protein
MTGRPDPLESVLRAAFNAGEPCDADGNPIAEEAATDTAAKDTHTGESTLSSDITVNTLDYGPVTLPCPPWCTQITHEDGGNRGDICHLGPATVVTVNSPSGPRELLTMFLSQWPYGLSAPGSDVYVAVHLADGDHPEFDVAGLEGLTADLLEAAGKVRYFSRRLQAEIQGGGR